MDTAFGYVKIKVELPAASEPYGKVIGRGCLRAAGPYTEAYYLPASSLFRPRRFASRERRGFFVGTGLRRLGRASRCNSGIPTPSASACKIAGSPASSIHVRRRGLHKLCVDDKPLADASVLQVSLAPVEPSTAAAQVDYFLRGRDLAITYAERPQPAMRTQIYWRARPPERAPQSRPSSC